jgi:hypothetical protein
MIRKDVEDLEKVTGQLEGMHREISLLAKKSSTDGLNKFKLNMLNSALSSANKIMGNAYKPIDGFDVFDLDDVPSNSDATIVLAIYLEELERYRADNIVQMHMKKWKYVLQDEELIIISPPKKLEF